MRKSQIFEEIDKLTNSIENAATGEVFDTEFYRITSSGKKQIKKKDWFFDWQTEIDSTDRQVYKLTIKDNEAVIQGLISLSRLNDHVFIHKVERVGYKQKNKKYLGVAGNMFAFACKLSKDAGLEGFVSFFTKTNLIEHYKETIGAKQFKGQRMIIDDVSASNLVNQYFKL